MFEFKEGQLVEPEVGKAVTKWERSLGRSLRKGSRG
jgi:hypothetical protein